MLQQNPCHTNQLVFLSYEPWLVEKSPNYNVTYLPTIGGGNRVGEQNSTTTTDSFETIEKRGLCPLKCVPKFLMALLLTFRCLL